MTPRLALRQQPDAAFEKLYRQHVGDVYRYTLAVLGNPADAEDVTQTTFMNAYRAFHDGERPRKAASWLRTIAHNVCRQRWRQASRRPHEVTGLDEAAGPAAPEEEAGPSAADITRALQSLPFNQRTALVMRELEGRRQAEIARELDLSESAVEALLFRARRAMREQLESSITCGEAARAISRQLDRSLSREEQAELRAHLRECEECATFARQSRAQRGAFKALGAVPLPIGLLAWSGGSGAGAGAASAGGSAGGLAAVAAGGTGAGATAAAVGGGTAAAFGLKVAAGVVAVVVLAGGGERVLQGPEVNKPSADAAAQRSGESPPASGLPVRLGEPRAAAVFSGGPAAPGRASRRGGASPDGKRPGGARSTKAPGSNGTHGTRTRAHGAPATSNGNATRAHGTPSQSHGTPTRAHGTPTHSQGTPTRAHGSPTQSNGGKPPPRDPPAQSNGTPTRAHGTRPEHPEKTPEP